MKSWYLINSNALTSGDESETYNYLKDSAIEELLDNEIACTVEICNYDLSERKTTRAIVNNKTQDTELKTLHRTMMFPIGSIVAGKYVYYDEKYWLVTSLVDDNGIFEKAIVQLCNYLLTWVNADGIVVQRWANVTSASQYNNGETSHYYFNVRTDQLMVLIPDDDESVMIETNQRFIIDRRVKILEKSIPETVDVATDFDVSVFRASRLDSVLHDYQGSGYYQLMAYQDEKSDTDGFYRLNGKGYWICNGDTVDEEMMSSGKRIEIECSDNNHKVAMYPKEFSLRYFNEQGKEVTGTCTWTVTCTFTDKLTIVEDATTSSITILATDKSLIGKKYTIKASAVGYTDVAKEITLRPFR